MRLWHKDLIPVLPRQQLLGQWRELCLIAKNIHEKGTPNHILVNKIMEYSIDHLHCYASWVILEMCKRGYEVNVERFDRWFDLSSVENISYEDMFKDWHNDRYLTQCYHNLEDGREI